ncbi:hypothetical protein GCM10010266_31440 [Streptomyces griseomycini]|nr:hypothetical protein GCM10010266_31440 [Streptomyces griseomycini]
MSPVRPGDDGSDVLSAMRGARVPGAPAAGGRHVTRRGPHRDPPAPDVPAPGRAPALPARPGEMTGGPVERAAGKIVIFWLASVSGTTVVGMSAHDALSATREAYDAAASVYAQLFRDELRDRPLDRAVLSAFAEVVSASGNGQVADLGCGPGHVTAHLNELGLAAFGVDASPAMVGSAREAYPDLRFDVGSMAALDIADGVLGGVLSRWSVIHTPPRELPATLAEFHRVLAPGGHLLVGFSASDGPSHPTQVFDHAVAPAYRWSPDHLAALLRTAGLVEVARMVREPQPTDRRQFKEIHLLARKVRAGAA